MPIQATGPAHARLPLGSQVPLPHHAHPKPHPGAIPTAGPASALTVHVFLARVGHQTAVVPTVGDPIVVVIVIAGVTLAIVV